MKKTLLLLITVLTIHFMGTSLLAADVTLAWDESPTGGVIGYKVYYKIGSSANYDGLPFVRR